jgi:hypothetical protein
MRIAPLSPRRRTALDHHTHLKQNPGHQPVGNDFDNLHLKLFLILASSIKETYLSHQIEGE